MHKKKSMGYMMRLRHLMSGIESYTMKGEDEAEVRGIAYDSRKVRPGYLFIAIKGHNQDGHRYQGRCEKRSRRTGCRAVR